MAQFLIPMNHGPYQDNGAAPWYAPLVVGKSNTSQIQNFALDTGTNMFWLTSTQCDTHACKMHNRFDHSKSSTFKWVDETPVDLSYGPWGNLKANIGSDDIHLPSIGALRSTFGLAIDYSGPKFEEVDWDACIGFPATGPTQHGFSFLMEDLFKKHPNLSGLVCFDWDYKKNTGVCEIGSFDINSTIFESGVFLPWNVYDKVKGVEYLWTVKDAEVSVNGSKIADNLFFGFDSGSSRFKGDPTVIASILKNLGGNTADVSLSFGQGFDGNVGKFVVPPDIYMRTIEKGQNAGKTLPQFAELDGVPELLIVGSVLMDHLYTIYGYQYDGTNVTPYGTWVFNKPGGPKIIQNLADSAEVPVELQFNETIEIVGD